MYPYEVKPGQALRPREQQALRGLLSGASQKQAAAALGISAHTFHGYVKRLYAKLGVQSRGELLALFIQLGDVAVDAIVAARLEALTHT